MLVCASPSLSLGRTALVSGAVVRPSMAKPEYEMTFGLYQGRRDIPDNSEKVSNRHVVIGPTSIHSQNYLVSFESMMGCEWWLSRLRDSMHSLAFTAVTLITFIYRATCGNSVLCGNPCISNSWKTFCFFVFAFHFYAPSEKNGSQIMSYPLFLKNVTGTTFCSKRGKMQITAASYVTLNVFVCFTTCFLTTASLTLPIFAFIDKTSDILIPRSRFRVATSLV